MNTKYVVAPPKLTPREPTTEMAMAANDAFPVFGETTCSEIGRTIWRAMWDAAPTPSPVPVDADELAGLRRDAERYRWLRDRMSLEDIPDEHPEWSTPSDHESAKVDAAIDTALAANGGKGT